MFENPIVLRGRPKRSLGSRTPALPRDLATRRGIELTYEDRLRQVYAVPDANGPRMRPE